MKNKRYKIEKVAYSWVLPAMLERRPYKTTTRFDGLTSDFCGKTGLLKTDKSRHNYLK